jgi:hypothetical protein
MTGAFFAAVPRDEQCAYCNGERRAATLAPDVQAIYCISLQEQPRRRPRICMRPAYASR